MKKCAFFLIIFSSSAWSQVNPGVLAVDQQTGRIGSLAIPLQSRTLLLASPSTPLYIRIRLDNGLSLRDTLVDLETSENQTEPITLSLYAWSLAGNLTAMPNAVQIVRWRAGENQVWIRITQPFSEMADMADFYDTFYVALGISEETGATTLGPLFNLYLSTLPNNSRWDGMVYQAQGTELFVNYPANTLHANSTLKLFIYTFQNSQGVRTAQNPDGIIAGTNCPNFLSSIRTIAYVFGP